MSNDMIIKIRADIQDIKQKLGEIESTSGSTFDSFSGKVIALNQALDLTQRVLSQVIEIASKPIEVGGEFEAIMSEVQAISGALGEQIQSLADDAKVFGSTTVFTAAQVGMLQKELSKLGFTVDQIRDMTGATLDLSVATGEDLANSASVAGGVLRAFNADAVEATRLIDVMAKSFSTSALDLGKFTTATGQSAKVASDAGFTFESLSAVLGILANNNIKAETTGTGVRNILLKINEQGSELSQILGGGVKSFDDFIARLETAASDSDAFAKAQKSVGLENAVVFTTLVSNVDKLVEYNEVLKDSEGAAQDTARIMQDNFRGAVTELQSALDGLYITIYNLVVGPLTEWAGVITDSVSGLNEFIKGIARGKLELEDTSDAISQAHIEATKLRSEFGLLTNQLLDLTSSGKLSNEELERRDQLVQQLQEQFPEYLANLGAEGLDYNTLAIQISKARQELDQFIQSQIAAATTQYFAEEIGRLNGEISRYQSYLAMANDKTKLFAFEGKTGAAAAKEIEQELANLQGELSSLTAQYEEALKASAGFHQELDRPYDPPDPPEPPKPPDPEGYELWLENQKQIAESKKQQLEYVLRLKKEYPELARLLGHLSDKEDELTDSQKDHLTVARQIGDAIGSMIVNTEKMGEVMIAVAKRFAQQIASDLFIYLVWIAAFGGAGDMPAFSAIFKLIGSKLPGMGGDAGSAAGLGRSINPDESQVQIGSSIGQVTNPIVIIPEVRLKGSDLYLSFKQEERKRLA